MEVTLFTWIVAIVGLLLMLILVPLQIIALLRPRNEWTLKNVYGGDPKNTDIKAYIAYNQGWAYADTFFWGPVQILGSVGMLLGERWGFLLALIGSVPFWYSSVSLLIWDRDLGFRKNTLTYWAIWGIFPLFGAIETIYCLIRLL